MTSVVYLPGTSGRGLFWDPVRERVRANTQTSLDWPGLGGTPVDPSVRSFRDVMDMTIRAITEPAMLVGQSMGGYVAAHIAIDRPDLVTHLVLAATSAGIDRAAIGLPEWTPALQPGDSVSAEWVTERQRPLDDKLAQIDIPVLLIWATGDHISPLVIGERIHELIRTSRLVTFESEDHWVARAHAVEVANEINGLIAGTDDEPTRSEVEIRQAQLSDLDSVQRCVADAYQPYVERIGRPPAPMLDNYESLVADGRVHIAVRGGQLEGLIVSWPNADHFYVDNIATIPAVRGTGTGARLMDWAERRARRAGLTEVRLYTNAAMVENVAYYERRGFTETHRSNASGYERIYFKRIL